MSKKATTLMAFTMVWMFAISMLSNCYCSPTEAAPQAKKMTSHCHQSSQEKNSDCAPRFQTDNFENSTLAAKTVEVPAISDLVVADTNLASVNVPVFSLKFESPPVSPPEFFVLHHAFLI